MPRIGFAYNQKPESPAIARPEDETPRGDEEPPSSRRDAIASRNSDSPASSERTRSATVGEGFATPTRAPLSSRADDEFAEWDSAETIDAVAAALATLGDVIRLEADDDFPQKLRDARPDIVFNIAEGLRGVNREAHVPAICEFYGIPYSASDPFTLSLCL
ncbi:MAG: ddl, partial [Geminicoccaceae bacterium]|nr:ddl [Geminicoccaceae bacterium]